jgi:Na+/H+ antiporter NhaD/arsenite permease-like protein
VVFISAILIVDAELWIASGVCAALVVVAFALRRRGELRVGLIPFRLLIFVTGFFLVVETFAPGGLSDVMHKLIGIDGGVQGLFRAAGTGAGLSNVVNNLPAYVAGEAVIPQPNHEQLLALLVGTNVGPIITPWASLATLLWYERCHAFGVDVPMRRFMATGAVLAVAGLLAVVGTLALTA